MIEGQLFCLTCQKTVTAVKVIGAVRDDEDCDSVHVWLCSECGRMLRRVTQTRNANYEVGDIKIKKIGPMFPMPEDNNFLQQLRYWQLPAFLRGITMKKQPFLATAVRVDNIGEMAEVLTGPNPILVWAETEDNAKTVFLLEHADEFVSVVKPDRVKVAIRPF